MALQVFHSKNLELGVGALYETMKHHSKMLLDAVYQIVEVVDNVAISNYPVQYLPEDNSARLHLVDWCNIRFGTLRWTFK